MSVSIDIVPFSDSLDMYGEPDRSAAYSISGHITISILSRPSFFERKRAVHLLLRSLVLTFEGQSELIAQEMMYSAVRLCSISQELISGGAIELNNEDHESFDSDKPCTWNVVFNLTIPGWLPPTALFGDVETGGETGTRYALYATAKFEHADESSGKTWLSTLCSPFSFSSVRTVKAPRYPVQLNRYTSPSSFPSSSTSLFPSANYNVHAEPELREDVHGNDARIPSHILSSLRVLASVPDYIGTDEESLPFSLRLRTAGLSEDECEQLRITQFAVDLEQAERYRTHPSPAYMAQHPMPPKNEQPPYKPLINPHPIHTLYDIGVAAYPPPRHVLTRTFSILPEDVSGRYTLAGDGYVFAQDARATENVTWYSMSTDIPISREDIQIGKDWKARRRIRESGQSPLFGVSHRLLVTLMCTYDLTDGETPERAMERLQFHIPLRFVRVPPPSPAVSRTSSPSPLGCCTPTSVLSFSGRSSPCDFPLPSLPYAQTLPAYSQLFYANGDRKIDYSTPLPLYTPKDPEADSASDLNHDLDEEN